MTDYEALPMEMFWYDLPTPEARDALAAELQREGHLIAHAYDTTVVSVTSRGDATVGMDIGRWDELAAKHGGVFDGWGVYVGPAESLRNES